MKPILLYVMFVFFISCSSSNKIKNSLNGNVHDKSYNKTSLKFVANQTHYQTRKIPANSILMGYIIDGYNPTKLQFEKMTHIAISFLRPYDSHGNIIMTPGWENLEEVVRAAHKNKVKAIISFGGGGFKVTSKLMGVSRNRKRLIENIILFMKQYNLDGFDCDWEPSWIDDKDQMEEINNAITFHYIKFIKEFRESLDAEFGKGEKSFSAAILNSNRIWYSSNKQIAHFPKNGWWHYLDWIALMNYDNDLGSKHSTFDSVFGEKGSISHWNNFGIPKSKIIIGIPFYGRAGWGEEFLLYKDIIKIHPDVEKNIDVISYKRKYGMYEKEYGFNGVSTVIKKVKESRRLELPGVMFWQLAGDVNVINEKSLLKAISEELRN